ncbi:MAG: hypothetical protein ACE5G0_09505, partial [Rhodothermales bacterium]
MKPRILRPLHDAIRKHPVPISDVAVRRTWLEIETTPIEAELAIPSPATAWVLFPRHTASDAYVAHRFNQSGLATMRAALDLDSVPFAFAAAVRRLQASVAWLRNQPEYAGQPVGIFSGGSPDVAVTMHMTSQQTHPVAGLACWGPAEAMTGYAGPVVRVPTLLLVGEADRQVRRWMRQRLAGPSESVVVPGLDAFLDDPAVMHRVAEVARPWFQEHKGSSLLVPVTPNRSGKRWKRRLATASLVAALGTALLPGTAQAGITVTLSSGTLTITGDSADDVIEVSTDSEGFILINGDFLLINNLSVHNSAVSALRIKAGGGNDRINLEGVTDSTFPGLSDIDIDGEAGKDTIIGTGKSDTIMGSDGFDS